MRNYLIYTIKSDIADYHPNIQPINRCSMMLRMLDGYPITKKRKIHVQSIFPTSLVYILDLLQKINIKKICQKPLAEWISPYQGTDHNGLFAFTKASTNIDELYIGETNLIIFFIFVT